MASAIKLSYHKRLFLMLLAFSWTIILCFIGFQYLREKQYKSEFLNAKLQLYNNNVLHTVEDGLSHEEYITTHAQPFDELRISIITLGGAVIYDNMLPLDSLGNHRKRPEIAQALQKGSAFHIGRQSTSDGREYFYSATKGKGVIVRTAIPYSASLRELLRADWNFLGTMIAISLAMSILAYFATRRLGKNIERLNRFAEKAEKGESFDEEEPFPNDELGSISNHIVKLYAQLQQTIKDRDTAHETAMREEQEKIRIKRQLTNNINHELKTPVASIQVCLETLLSGISISEEKRQELIERCYTNNERLRRLLGDVSLITRMEDGSSRIEREMVDLRTIVNEIASDVALLPDDKRMRMNIDLPSPMPVYGNSTLLVSIIKNLTDNAIAYSGGRDIYVKCLGEKDGMYTISFADNGIGIEDDHIEYIFERFYRIDKGRSRKLGGTGLGLSIVKNGVLFHGGTIEVKNRKVGGLEFTFTLPMSKREEAN